MKAFLLHHANRAIKDFCWGQYAGDFYRVKDAILRKHGKHAGYDIQHIEGKKCHTCNGTGLYPRWDQYGIYDPDGCWHCAATGWYKDPQWICLERITFGKYTFHRPLKREYGVKNPFTKESLGWDVSERPIVNGYIEHNSAWIGKYAIALIMLRTPDFKLICKRILNEWKWYWQSKVSRITRHFAVKRRVIHAATFEQGEDLPF